MLRPKYLALIPNTDIFFVFLIEGHFLVKAPTGIAVLFLKPLGSVKLSIDISENEKKLIVIS